MSLCRGPKGSLPRLFPRRRSEKSSHQLVCFDWYQNMTPLFEPGRKQNCLLTPFGTKKKKHTVNCVFFLFCAEGRARTGDPILFRDMLYQLSYLGNLFYFNITYWVAGNRPMTPVPDIFLLKNSVTSPRCVHLRL